MSTNTEFVVHVESKIKNQQAVKGFLESWNARVRSPSRYEFFQNGENLRVIEIYSSSEDFLKHLHEVVVPNIVEVVEVIEISSVSFYGQGSDEVKQAVADFNPTYYERIGKADSH